MQESCSGPVSLARVSSPPGQLPTNSQPHGTFSIRALCAAGRYGVPPAVGRVFKTEGSSDDRRRVRFPPASAVTCAFALRVPTYPALRISQPPAIIAVDISVSRTSG